MAKYKPLVSDLISIENRTKNRDATNQANKTIRESITKQNGSCANCSYFSLPKSFCSLKAKQIKWYNYCEKHSFPKGI